MNKNLTLEDIERALENVCDKQSIGRLTWHRTDMVSDDGEPLYLVDLGANGYHAYIGGTKKQLEERINLFYKHLIDEL